MEHSDHVALIRAGIPAARPQVWADLGCGLGAFSLALADILGAGSTIYGIDRKAPEIKKLDRNFKELFPKVVGHFSAGDFTKPLELPALDGVIMANSLHFVPYEEQEALLRQVTRTLKSGGTFLLVEYNADKGNMWVPCPISTERLEKLTKALGFSAPVILHRERSQFLKEIYSAATTKGK